MAIIRVLKDKDYTTMSNCHLKDKRLSWKSKGLLSYLLSMSDDWQIYQKELVKHSTDGISATRSAFNELEQFGYINRKNLRDEDGKFNGVEYVVYEKGLAEIRKSNIGKSDNGESDNGKSNTNNNLPKQILKITNTKDNNSSPAKAEPGIPYKEIVDYLNKKADRNFKHTTGKTRRLIKARWNEGFDLEDFENVIDTKVGQWLMDTKMDKYIRPDTLFSGKFEGYLNEKGVSECTQQENYNDIIL